MRKMGTRAVRAWVNLGPRYLPFADIVTPDLSFTRLLRLTLFQVSVGMALVLLVGTLNRVMIVELGVPATIVAVMIAVPVLFAPFRALIGFSSDNHRSALGWRRVPFIWRGTLLQFGGFAIMPFALLVLAGEGEAAHAPVWIGQLAAGLSFLLVGAGAHTVQTAGLALATDLTPPESHAKVVGLMYVMLLVGMMLSALVFGLLLSDFSPGRLIQVIQGAAIVSMVLNVIAMWKQETRRPMRELAAEPSFREAWAILCQKDRAIRLLVVVGLGTMAFGMADVLLEPFGGEVLGLSVSATTRLTALLALGGLLGFGLASSAIGRGHDPHRIVQLGTLIGLPAFVLVMVAAPLGRIEAFLIGNFLIGLGGALLSHGTLTATMSGAPAGQAGLALGAWGAVQATSAGAATALGGITRDAVQSASFAGGSVLGLDAVAGGYFVVYLAEMVLLVATVVVAYPLLRREDAPGRLGTPRAHFSPAAIGPAVTTNAGEPEPADG